MVESVLLIGLGGLIGMGLAALILPAIGPKSMGMLPPHVPTPTWLMGLGLIVVIGIIVGLLLRAKRLKIVDALAGR